MQGELAAQAEWDYAPAPESRDVLSIAPEYGLFIDGEFVPAADGRQFATVNPATEEPLAQVADAGEADVDRAVAAARAAYGRVWGPRAGPGRGRARTVPGACTASPAGCRSAPASSRCWRASTTASRSRNPATSTSRWPRRTSSTTRAGPTSWSTPGSGRRRGRWGWPAR